MRSTKVVIAIVAFVSTFVFSAGLVRILFGTPEVKTVFTVKPRCSDRYANDIYSLLKRDIRNGHDRSQKIYRMHSDSYSIARQAAAVAEYVDASSSMDDSSLPRDFQTAWREHMRAWRDYSDFLDRMASESNRKSLGPKRFEIIETHHNNDINMTWEEVLRIGRSYGARVY